MPFVRELAPGVFTKPAAAGVAECEAEQCPMSVGLHGKHTCNYSQGLVICNLGFFLDLWYFGIQDIIYLCTRKSCGTSGPLVLLATSVKCSLVSERSCFCIVLLSCYSLFADGPQPFQLVILLHTQH